MTTLCSMILGMGLASCAEELEMGKYYPELEAQSFLNYVLNEGTSGADNANISGFVYNATSNEVKAEGDLYLMRNQKPMGDVANAMMEEDGKMYVVLNGSRYVAKLGMICDEEARYTFPEAEGAPRSIDVEDDYAYVTQYGGQVSKLNIEDMTLAGTFKGGDNLEGIVEKNGKLYVANSYTVDESGNVEYKKEVFVIDAKTMTLEKTIDVVDNPTKLYEIDDQIYLISGGNNADVAGALQIIDPQSNTSKVVLNNVTKITEGNDDLIYGVSSTYDANWQLTNSFFIYHPKMDEVSQTSFLKHVSFRTNAICLLEVDEATGYIYVGTNENTTNGTIYQFDKSGKLLHQYNSGGISPSAIVFVE